MTIRTKVLVLMCVVALLPALLTAWLDVRILRSLGAELTTRTSSALSDQALAAMHERHRRPERGPRLAELHRDDAAAENREPWRHFGRRRPLDEIGRAHV